MQYAVTQTGVKYIWLLKCNFEKSSNIDTLSSTPLRDKIAFCHISQCNLVTTFFYEL